MTKLPRGSAGAPRGLGERDGPLSVEVPVSSQDKPAWVKVGAIAAIGFVVGIAWPRLLGVRLGPSAPGEAAAAAAAAASASAQTQIANAGRAPDAPPASVVAKSSPPASASGATSPDRPSSGSSTGGAPPNITVQKGTVLSCKTAEGETKKGSKDCGSVPGIDQLVTPRVRKIATCSGVEGQTGKLSIVVNADFASGRFWYDVGKSSTVQNLDAITSCLKTTFHGTSTTATPHEHPRYTVAYTAILAPGSGATDSDEKAHDARRTDKDSKNAKEAADKAEKTEKADKADKADKTEKTEDGKSETAPSDRAPSLGTGEAAVAWEVALVRDAPKTGNLVSRLARGTKVKVGTSKDGWYQIKFGDGFANDGWVYRGAIGR
jgi:hypothetical protein